MLVESLRYLHITSLAMWFGGLFGYVVIVWPSIVSSNSAVFPRQLLTTIALRTAPWIYLAMVTAIVTATIYLLGNFDNLPIHYKLLYLLVLLSLAANNVYGSLIAWPKIMLSPESGARRAWTYFYCRMVASLVFGLALMSSAILATG